MSTISTAAARTGIVALLVVALAGCATPVAEPAAEPSPVAEEVTPVAEETCSPEEVSDPTSFTVTNATAEDVTIFWYSYDCRLESYVTLTPDQTETLETYVGHIWAAMPTDVDTVLSEFTAVEGAGEWTIG